MTAPLVAPTDALANSENIQQNSSTSAAPQALADRVDTLNAAGHAWMPSDMQTTLAAAPTSDNEMVQVADSIKSSLAKAWNGFSEATDDNVLHKQPTAALALTRMMNASLGPLPVAQPDLNVIQKNLQKQGFGADLSADGVWGADWNDAYNQYTEHVITRQLAGDQPGSVSTGSAGHSIWSDLLPSHAVNAIVGFAKSIPDDVRDLAADSLSSAVNLAHDPLSVGKFLNPLTGIYAESTAQDQSSVAKRVGAAVQSIGGSKVTPEQYEATHGDARLAQNIGLLLNLVPIAGQASKAADVARAAFDEGVTKEAAQRGPGVVAKSLFGGQTTDQAAAGLERRGILNSNVVRNIPLLGQVGPVVGKLADEDGLYYKARTLLAAPYQRPAVRAAGDIGQRTMLTGAAVRAGAQATQAVGLGNTETQDVTQGQALSTVDANLDRITGTPGAHPFTAAVNSLGFLLHGPLGDTANSVRVGDAVQASVDATSDALGQVGLHGIFQRAIAKASGTKMRSVDDLASDFGGQEYLDRFITMKTADLAAAHAAQNQAQTEGLAFGSDDYRDRVGQVADDVWADPQQHVAAVRELMADPIEMENRVAADMTHANLNPKEYASDAVKWMQAGDTLTNKVVKTGLARYLFGADGKTVIQNAQDAFDFGLGQENPIRLSSQTRREYVNGVYDNLDRVRKGVDKARVQTGQAVVAAQSKADETQANLEAIAADHPDRPDLQRQLQLHQGDVKRATTRQQRIEQGVGENRIDKVVRAMKQVSGPKGSDSEWDQLAKSHAALRKLVVQGLPPGQSFDLATALEHGIDPDQLYSNINGEPRNAEHAIGGGDWMRANLPHKDGALGLGRVTTKSAQQAATDIAAMRADAEAATTPEAQEQTLEAMQEYGFREFGMTQRTLGMYDDPQRLADVLQERAGDLASDVFLTPDAPGQVRAHIKALADLGYKPMLGSHIGHLWDSSLPPIGDVDGEISRRRRIVSALGLAPEQVSSRAAGQDARIRVLNEMQRTVNDDKRVVLPPRTTAETVLQVLNDKNILTPTMKLPERVAFTVTKRFHQPGIDELARQTGLSLKEAEQKYTEDLSRVLQVRDIPRKAAMKALTTPADFENGARWEGMDAPSAALMLRAALRGYAQRPNYIMGLSSIEDMGRNGFYIGDKLATTFPNSGAIQAFANAPNELIQLRNRLRFTLSPFFDFRRVTKTNYKMSLDGVTPVLNPLKHLVDTKTFDTAHAYLNDLLGEPEAAGYDDADRYLHQQSVWGLYNSRHYEAYYADQKRAAGATDDEVRAGIRRVFEYGSERKAGRSALERTANTIFFPFSFEKTLLRNTGAYLLDHPQQALLLTGAMQAYRNANSNDQISQWTQDHLPILRDMQKMNAFAHGISPGEFGGINAPLMNLFLPQKWDGDMSTANLKKNLPVWNDFGSLLSDVHQQADIGRNAAENAASYAVHLGAPRSALDPYKPTVTAEAQRRDAEAMRNKAILAWTPVLDYNVHHETNPVRFPDDPRLPGQVQGQPVNRTTIGYLVQRWFPAYDPSFGVTYAEQQQKAADAYLGKLRETDPAKAQQYTVFAKLANSVAGHLQDGTYDTAQATQVMTQFRQAATDASETDPTFASFYRNHYQFIFGPLEAVNP